MIVSGSTFFFFQGMLVNSLLFRRCIADAPSQASLSFEFYFPNADHAKILQGIVSCSLRVLM